MLIRLASENDLAALMVLMRRIVPLMQAAGNFQWNDGYPNEQVFRQDIELKQLWIAEIEDSIAGVAAITTDQEPEYAQADWEFEQRAIVVHRLAVDPAFRGAVVAVALMQKAEEIAVEGEIRFVRVDTCLENVATQRLFPKLGYRMAGEIGLSIRPNLRFLCYEKRVQESRA